MCLSGSLENQHEFNASAFTHTHSLFLCSKVGGGIAFFKGVAEKQANGIVKVTVKGGLPAGSCASFFS
jgi:hypothetical protein